MRRKKCVHYWIIAPSYTEENGKLQGKCKLCGEEREFLTWGGVITRENFKMLPARTRGQIKRLENFDKNEYAETAQKFKCTLKR